MNVTKTRRLIPVLTATALLAAIAALPAAASQDAGPLDQTIETTHFCTLARVGTQFIACDNLTGNGVPAPAWVAER